MSYRNTYYTILEGLQHTFLGYCGNLQLIQKLLVCGGHEYTIYIID